MKSNLQQYLQQELKARQAKNSRYSLRRFARDLGIDPTALSRILTGQRAASLLTARRILSRLRLSASTREALLRSLIAPETEGIPLDSDYTEITPEQAERLNDWAYSAILELLRSPRARMNAASIAAYLGKSVSDVESMLKTLIELGLLRQSEKGLHTVHERTTTPFRAGSPALARAMGGYIDRAKEALEHHPANSHDISGATLMVARERLPEANRRIREFRRSLARYLGAEGGQELYRINIQLFSLKDVKSMKAKKRS